MSRNNTTTQQINKQKVTSGTSTADIIAMLMGTTTALPDGVTMEDIEMDVPETSFMTPGAQMFKPPISSGKCYSGSIGAGLPQMQPITLGGNPDNEPHVEFNMPSSQNLQDLQWPRESTHGKQNSYQMLALDLDHMKIGGSQSSYPQPVDNTAMLMSRMEALDKKLNFLCDAFDQMSERQNKILEYICEMYESMQSSTH